MASAAIACAGSLLSLLTASRLFRYGLMRNAIAISLTVVVLGLLTVGAVTGLVIRHIVQVFPAAVLLVAARSSGGNDRLHAGQLAPAAGGARCVAGIRSALHSRPTAEAQGR